MARPVLCTPDDARAVREDVLRGDVVREDVLWALDALISQAAEARPPVERRNAALREAAALIPGSRWSRAHRLLAECAAVAGGRPGAEDRAVRALVVEALEAAPAPRSLRSFLRLLGD